MCDASDQLIFEAMTRLAERHDNSEWSEIAGGLNVLVLPLSNLQNDSDVEVDLRSTSPTNELQVQIARDPEAINHPPEQAGWAIAVPEADYPEEGAGRIRFGGQNWTLYVSSKSPAGHALDTLRSLKAPELEEIEDIDAREKWFKGRH